MGAYENNLGVAILRASALEKTSGDYQSVDVGGDLPKPLVVRVLDQYSEPMSSITVTFAPDDGASVNPTQATTDANGQAQTIVTLLSVKPEYHVIANADGLEPVVFTATTTTLLLGTLTLNLNNGLNMISLPNHPETPYTAKSFAEKIRDVTVIIRYTNKFESYLPGHDEDDGFPIEGGQGYIINLVNVTQSKPVNFTGTVWDNANPAPIMEGNAPVVVWAFVVTGELPTQLRDAGNLTVTVRNVNRNIRRECSPSPAHSGFRVAFVDVDRNAVIEAGELLSIEVADANGRLVAKEHLNVEPGDLAKAFAIVNPRYNPIPKRTILLQNYPNPFNPETWIPFQLSASASVTISIYDISGNLIRTLLLGNRRAGIYITKDSAAYWNGRNVTGERVSSGVYFYQINVDKFSATKRMLILK